MSAKDDVLAWANKILSRSELTPYAMLGVLSSATPEKISDAFHKIARTSHPDLHRGQLTPEELELVTRAYSKVAGAYQDLRSGRYQPPARPSSMDAPAGGVSARMAAVAPSAGAPAAAPAAPGAAGMNSKAQLYWRKAEMSLRKGDLKGALLQLKMAIAADPTSTQLKTALAELQAELAKGG